MYLPDFDYYAPATVKEACSTLARLDGGARVLAGVTDLLPYMKNEVMAPTALVSLQKIQGLREIAYLPGRGLVIGAQATQNALMRSPLLQERYPSVCETAHSMANYQIRNRGTIGGNLVSAIPSADLPPILIAPDEILTEIVIPDQATTASAYLKFGLRRSGEIKR
jgi:aerobic carbon-monoxide dehydrogenase medium subunit